jgi:hypothetical protein
MRLAGALSNQAAVEKLSRLNHLRKTLLREAAKSPRPAKRSRPRSGAIQQAVVQVLTDAAEPMHAAKVHAVVERLLGRSVSRDTVNSCLSVGARDTEAQFERLGRGRYRLRREPR